MLFRSKSYDERREADMIKLKKHDLSIGEQKYNANRGTVIEVDYSGPRKDKITTKRKHKVHVIPNGCNENDDTTAPTSISTILSHRSKYRRRSIDVWKEACQTANHVYNDDELPSLEEAARLFGYTN